MSFVNYDMAWGVPENHAIFMPTFHNNYPGGTPNNGHRVSFQGTKKTPPKRGLMWQD